MSVDGLREEIKAADLLILEQMKRRLALAREVGLCKIREGIDVVDPSVEAAVVARYRAFAEENGMDPDCAEGVCRILIEESVRLQESLR